MDESGTEFVPLGPLQLAQDLAGLGEPSDILLREDHLSVDRHLEHTAVSRDELGVNPEVLLQLGRQTGGPGLVASFVAVLDPDVHGEPSRPGYAGYAAILRLPIGVCQAGSPGPDASRAPAAHCPRPARTPPPASLLLRSSDRQKGCPLPR